MKTLTSEINSSIRIYNWKLVLNSIDDEAWYDFYDPYFNHILLKFHYPILILIGDEVNEL